MKNILFTLALLVSFSSFGQTILDFEMIDKAYPNMIYGIHDENGTMEQNDGYLGPDHITEFRFKEKTFESDFIELEFDIKSLDKDGNPIPGILRYIEFHKYVPGGSVRELRISFYSNGDIKGVTYY